MITLREARLQALLSMRQLARLAEISPTTVYLLERGLRRPQPLTAYKLSRALGVEPPEIVEFQHVLSNAEPRNRSDQEGIDA